MKVTTKSDQPHLRSTETPYTAATIRINSSGTEKEQELAFLALLVQALNPRIGLKRVNEALSDAIATNPRLKFGTDNKQ